MQDDSHSNSCQKWYFVIKFNYETFIKNHFLILTCELPDSR